jgi:hypothetical protein
MNSKEFVVIGIIFLAMFTIFKIENDKLLSKSKNGAPVRVLTADRPSIFEMYE